MPDDVGTECMNAGGNAGFCSHTAEIAKQFDMKRTDTIDRKTYPKIVAVYEDHTGRRYGGENLHAGDTIHFSQFVKSAPSTGEDVRDKGGTPSRPPRNLSCKDHGHELERSGRFRHAGHQGGVRVERCGNAAASHRGADMGPRQSEWASSHPVGKLRNSGVTMHVTNGEITGLDYGDR